MGTGEYWDSSPSMWVHWINGRYQIHWSLRPPLRLLVYQTQTVPPLYGCYKRKPVQNQFIHHYILIMQWHKDDTWDNIIGFILSVLPCCNNAGCLNNLLGGLHVATLSHMHHGGPAGSDDTTRPRTSYWRRCVNSSLPIRGYKVLVVAIFLVSVDHHWGSFGCIAILWRINQTSFYQKPNNILKIMLYVNWNIFIPVLILAFELSKLLGLHYITFQTIMNNWLAH